jgi:myo-inositol-1(or 4)-monophosphatase
MLDFAVDTARAAGQILLEKFGRRINISRKGETNLVTEADLASEALIVDRIRSKYPKHSLLAEESGHTASVDGHSAWRWIIDPLDGTTNFAHGYPCFAVTMALEHEGKIVIGVTYDPTRDEMFAAERGRGATLNNKPIHVSETSVLKDSLLVTGFPYEITKREDLIQKLTNFLLHARGVRRDGSAAIDLAYVACGRFDGFWEDGLNAWDVAAGILLIEEAGGRLSDYKGRECSHKAPPICASNGLIHQQMIEILNS